MRYFRDIGLLILYSLLALFFIDADSIFICALLCTVILLCCCYIFENHVIAALLFLTYGLAVLVLPDFLLFSSRFYLCYLIQPSAAVPAMGRGYFPLPVSEYERIS